MSGPLLASVKDREGTRTAQRAPIRAPARTRPPAPDLPAAELAVDPDRVARFVLRILVGCELLLVLLDATVNQQQWSTVGSIRRLVNITREDGIGNWLASSQELLVAGVAAAIFLRARQLAPRRLASRGWAVVAAFFLYVSFDDGTKFHERVGTWVKETTSGATGQGGPAALRHLLDAFPSYPWQVVFLPFFAAAGLLGLVFLWRAFAGTGLRRFLVAGLGCLAAAVGMDGVEGLERGWAFLHPITGWPAEDIVHYAKSAEELLEMFGTTLLLVAFLRYFGQLSRGWRLRVGEAPPG